MERHLVDRICSGDLSAFQELVENHKRKVYYLAYDIVGDHQEAEDVSQEVFIKVYRSIHTFRKDAKMSSWIHHITVNSAIDVLRKHKARPKVNLEHLDQAEAYDNPPGAGSAFPNPEKTADASLLQGRIQDALHKVSPRERTVFMMRHYNDFQISEIADVLEVSTGTVKSLLFRALHKLRKELSSYTGNARWEASYE
jgi:RNA polymerase sigma-70 factor (ECF subfamily)